MIEIRKTRTEVEIYADITAAKAKENARAELNELFAELNKLGKYKENHFEVGDLVRAKAGVNPREIGGRLSTSSYMRRWAELFATGKVLRVYKTAVTVDTGLSHGGVWNFPIENLELA